MAFAKENPRYLDRPHQLPFPLDHVNYEILGWTSPTSRRFILLDFDHRKRPEFGHQLLPPSRFPQCLPSDLIFFFQDFLCQRQLFPDVLEIGEIDLKLWFGGAHL